MIVRRKFAKLEKSLGYRFKQEALLERALTHASVTGEIRGGQKKEPRHAAERSGNAKTGRRDNEAMEFVGDRVLGLVIAELLSERFPDANEGELARIFNKLVRRETCAAVGREIDVGEFLLLSVAEDESGGRNKTTIIADAMEAILAAVFTDSNYGHARTVVRALWESHIRVDENDRVDAKTALQEWAQSRSLALPRYREVERTGPDHAPRFTIEVIVRGLEPARGEGASKRLAEQAAATAMLLREGVRRAVHDE